MVAAVALVLPMPGALGAARVPRIRSFTASAEHIHAGERLTLSWRVEGARRIVLRPDIGVVRRNSIEVAPSEDTTYELIATGGGERVRARLPISVLPPHGPFIDERRIPPAQPGFAADRVRATAELPGASDGTGAFRTVCTFSHMNFDDPIVAPGRSRASHLHTFFGNTATDAASTASSIASTGDSTCRGGTVNRTAYWTPALIDTLDGSPITPSASHFYYKTGYRGVAPGDVQPLPEGLRIVAGSKDARAAQPGVTRWKCVGGDDSLVGASIPDCRAGSELWQEIFFPQCWDGVHLDAPDHRSHMAYPDGGCPSTHPVAIPEISFNIVYPVMRIGQTRTWRLSSDAYNARMPGGYSSHADWFNGWRPEVVDAWVTGCEQAALDCHSHLLGDGREIF